ncbi:hypothetical protein AUP43_03095 [Oceanibaculum pacificum]|uniref:IclR family transcriptional regulator n=1 Tax=Oceanibaculum pacificum TaxID=580166 RepID=A0A154VS50_9PROT|nr:hypothetical protein AUP43_03095 [Oceanibaculum pacificum]
MERYVMALEAVAASPHGLSLSSLAQQCDLPVATTHRLLQALQKTGLVTASGGKRKDYQLGMRLLRLLHAGADDAWVQIAVQPVLDRLANRFGETCFVTRLTGNHVMSLAWAVPEKGLRGYVFPGHMMPPHASASAKAILAYQAPAFIDEILSQPLVKLAQETKTDPAAVKADYAEVRDRRYATCWNEMEPGVGALAVPIELPDVGVIYSLGASGLIERLNSRPLDESLEMMRAAADNLSRALRNSTPARMSGDWRP